MAREPVKKWTILNYANGNNEYEPEMYRALMDSEKPGSDDDINIVIQIGRTEREMTRIIRPREKFEEDGEEWTGVRRYIINEQKAEMVEDVGRINMAAPKSLYDFIFWGIKNYPAEHYALILGGHGAAFVGTLTDYSQEVPYIMGTVEMCKAINMILKDTGRKIDLLILDICYMNLAEIMYELGKEKQNTVQSVITYIGTGPVSGMPCDRLIDIIRDCSKSEVKDFLIRNIIDNMGFSLLAIDINPNKLKSIKRAANELAYSYLTNRGEKKYTPFEVLTSLNEADPWYKNAVELQKELSSIIIHYNKLDSKSGNLLNIIFMQLKGLLNVYYKLGFAKTNYWTYLLGDKPVDEKLDIKMKENFMPTKIKPDGLRSLIQAMNPGSDDKSIEDIFEKLVANRGWKWENEE